MSEEEIRKILKEEVSKQIMNEIDSTLIFEYVKNLEEENKMLSKTNTENAKSVLDAEKQYYDLKNKIRDKIKELEEKTSKEKYVSHSWFIDGAKIEVLKSIIGE